MKKASIISIGNELLSGATVDTNAAFLSTQLLKLGVPVVTGYTIGDTLDSIVNALKLAVADADFVLVTGGLGPTDDDLTRQGFAEFLGCELELRPDLLQKIETFFTSRNRKFSPVNRIQAYIPAGAEAIENNFGTAPGIMVQTQGKLIVSLPGVPSEMKQMFEETVFDKIKTLAGSGAIAVRKLKCFGTGESNIAEMLGDLMARKRNPLINCTVSYGVITLHIIAKAEDKNTADAMAEKDEQMLVELLGDLVYGSGEQSLAEVLGRKLIDQQKKIAIAESCTGGLIAKLLTDIPGASKYFTHGWVTYSNTAKTQELGVPAELIEKYGAVSEQVASAMACAAAKKAGSDVAIGITGIAGPEGGSEQKPVGLVYIAVMSDNSCSGRRFVFSHDRRFVRFRAAQTALNMLRLKLQS
ncbi:competence/damage-inducible protein A [Planctomycetota bacterium]